MQTERKESFRDVINGDIPVLVDFFAEWCGPCKMMMPILRQLRDQMKESVRILKLDVDKNPAMARAFGVQGVPTLVLFHKGSIRWRQSGLVTANVLENIIRQHLSQA
jgi:thioredoxin 1